MSIFEDADSLKKKLKILRFLGFESKFRSSNYLLLVTQLIEDRLFTE